MFLLTSRSTLWRRAIFLRFSQNDSPAYAKLPSCMSVMLSQYFEYVVRFVDQHHSGCGWPWHASSPPGKDWHMLSTHHSQQDFEAWYASWWWEQGSPCFFSLLGEEWDVCLQLWSRVYQTPKISFFSRCYQSVLFHTTKKQCEHYYKIISWLYV